MRALILASYTFFYKQFSFSWANVFTFNKSFLVFNTSISSVYSIGLDSHLRVETKLTKECLTK